MIIKFNMIPSLFSIHEQELRKYIDENDSSFLGLFADFFKDVTRKELIKIIHGFSHPLGEYIANLRQYPALLATLMTVVILEGFGSSGNFRVYRHIELLLNIRLSEADKRELWKAYRKACLTLGLSVSPRTSGPRYIVHEFLRQAGLPLGYASKFCEKAIKYADRVGLPDDDNPEDINLWQQKLVQTLKPPFSKIARESIERDETGYYVGMFISLYRNRDQNIQNPTRLEQKMLDTILSAPSRQTMKKARIPQVIFRNFMAYGVLFPSGEKGSWLMDTGEHQTQHITRGEELFVPFDDHTLPPSVTLTDDNNVSWHYDLWQDRLANRLLIFSLPSGKLVRPAALTDKEISLEPGEYTLMLRFPPRDEQDVEHFSDDPELFIKKHILLSPGDRMDLRRGPVTLTLKADEIPLLLWQCKPIRGVRGNEFYPAKSLKLKVVIPEEMKTPDAEFYLELRSAQLGEDIHVPVIFADDTHLNLDLEPWIKPWKAGVARLQVILRRKGSGRLVVRRSIVIWNGLSTIDDRCVFRCHRLPENVDLDRCENLKPDMEKKTCSYRDETNQFFKMSFKDTHQNHEFVWAVPGIFLGVVDYSDQRQTEKTIAAGTTLSVKTSSRKMLKIYATTPATLSMETYSQYVNFTRVGSVTIPLANLQTYMGSGKNTLFMSREDWSEPLPLVHLVSPFTAMNFYCNNHGGGNKIEIKLAETIQGIRIIAENLLDGTRFETQLSNVAMAQGTLLPGVVVSGFYEPSGQLTLYVSGNKWPPGMWLIHFHVKASGRWGMLTNENHQFYAEGKLSSENVVYQEIHGLFQRLCPSAKDINGTYFKEESDGKEAMEMFHRLQHALFPRYAADIWHRLVWLEQVWTRICSTYLSRIEDGDKLSTLLQLSTRWRDDSLQEGELPSLHLGAMLPRMYGLDRNQYRIKGEIRNSLLSVFKIMPHMGNLVDRFSHGDLEMASLLGFSNFRQASVNHEMPRGFSWDLYKAGLSGNHFTQKSHLLFDDQWIPGKGDYLGIIHYRYAVMKLKKTFENNLDIKSLIRGKALFMVRALSSKTLRHYCSHDSVAGFTGTMDLGLWNEENATQRELSEETATRQEHYQSIIRFVSLFAQVCRMECRQPGTMDAFLRCFESLPGLTAKECRESLAFLLYVGEDLFAFNLLLWEMIFTADYSYS